MFLQTFFLFLVFQVSSLIIDNDTIGGTVTCDIDEHPYFIFVYQAKKPTVCGGVIVADEWVIIEDYCMKESGFIGDQGFVRTQSEPFQVREINLIQRCNGCGYVLIRHTGAFKRTSNSQPISLPEKNEKFSCIEAHYEYAFYEKPWYPELKLVMQCAKVRLFDRRDCWDDTSHFYDKKIICGKTSIDICQQSYHHSGGPLICYDKVIGVLAWKSCYKTKNMFAFFNLREYAGSIAKTTGIKVAGLDDIAKGGRKSEGRKLASFGVIFLHVFIFFHILLNG